MVGRNDKEGEWKGWKNWTLIDNAIGGSWLTHSSCVMCIGSETNVVKWMHHMINEWFVTSGGSLSSLSKPSESVVNAAVIVLQNDLLSTNCLIPWTAFGQLQSKFDLVNTSNWASYDGFLHVKQNSIPHLHHEFSETMTLASENYGWVCVGPKRVSSHVTCLSSDKKGTFLCTKGGQRVCESFSASIYSTLLSRMTCF